MPGGVRPGIGAVRRPRGSGAALGDAFLRNIGGRMHRLSDSVADAWLHLDANGFWRMRDVPASGDAIITRPSIFYRIFG